jgi:hypothetical protein
MNMIIQNANVFLLMLFLACLTLGSCERATELDFLPKDAGNEDAAP